MDVRTLQTLKKVGVAWRARVRKLLGDPTSTWHADPIWADPALRLGKEKRVLVGSANATLASYDVAKSNVGACTAVRQALCVLRDELDHTMELPAHLPALLALARASPLQDEIIHSNLDDMRDLGCLALRLIANLPAAVLIKHTDALVVAAGAFATFWKTHFFDEEPMSQIFHDPLMYLDSYINTDLVGSHGGIRTTTIIQWHPERLRIWRFLSQEYHARCRADVAARILCSVFSIAPPDLQTVERIAGILFMNVMAVGETDLSQLIALPRLQRQIWQRRVNVHATWTRSGYNTIDCQTLNGACTLIKALGYCSSSDAVQAAIRTLLCVQRVMQRRSEDGVYARWLGSEDGVHAVLQDATQRLLLRHSCHVFPPADSNLRLLCELLNIRAPLPPGDATEAAEINGALTLSLGLERNTQ